MLQYELKEGEHMFEMKISVRELVEFISRSGSISDELVNPVRAIEGVRIHQMIQKRQPDHYTSEVTLTYTHVFDQDTCLILQGRADGIIETENGVTIDEIKSTSEPLEEIHEITHHLVHYDQARIYAYIYATKHQLTTISVQLTYYQIDTDEIKQFQQELTLSELSQFFQEKMDAYYRFVQASQNHLEKRNQSLHDLAFPYADYRPGQKEMAISVYNTIIKKENLFIQAATGIGKTMSTLYPALRALERGHTSKIMYLTAKTITRQVAEDSLNDLRRKQVHIRSVTLTAKEKICFLQEPNCNPQDCPYANHHYDRVNDALYEILVHEENMNRSCIEHYAKKHQVCPFEFSLDLFNFCDVSISDYNYAFDPKVYLKRAFDTGNDYVLLVDEAHNLVDRARNMYSATLSLTTIQSCLKAFTQKKGKLYQATRKLSRYIKELQKANQETPLLQKEVPVELIDLMNRWVNEARPILPELKDEAFKQPLQDLYFMVLDMQRILEFYDNEYVTYMEEDINDTRLTLYCLNPRKPLRQVYRKANSVILFSATLIPINYFYDLLGGKTPDRKLYFASPFSPDNKCLLIARDFKATYRYRESYLTMLSDYLKKVTSYRQGHYLIFFPSYQYLNLAYTHFHQTYPDLLIEKQEQNLSEQERDLFLERFKQNTHQTTLFFCVLGGLFSEGLDFKGDQVIGVVIVSVGLPQLSLERDLIKTHFDHENKGYEYAYVYPGFNKVLQAAGRLIRHENDRGIILLLDERYQKSSYTQLFPVEWSNARLTSLQTIEQQVTNFASIFIENNE